MQLSVRDAAKLLQISEEMIYRRIKDGTLLAHKISGQYWFHRSELLEWATANGISISPHFFQREKDGTLAVPLVFEALEFGGIHHDVSGGTPRSTLESVVERLPLSSQVDRSFLLEILLAREALGSTAIGEGIAIPHVRNPIILDPDQKPILSLCFLREPVDFQALDGQKVFALFTLVCPTIRVHLQMLSRLAFVLSDGPFRDDVTKRQSAERLLATLRAAESQIHPVRAAAE